MFELTSEGSYNGIERFLRSVTKRDIFSPIEKIAQYGVDVLAQNTPYDTGGTANSWSYSIHRTKTHTTISWANGNLTREGTPVALLLQYGHATGTGGYVQGYDYINPSIRPIFDDIADSVWKVVVDL